MKRARVDDVKAAIKLLPKKQQENVMLIAKTHGVNDRFIELLEDENGDKNCIDAIQKYIDEMKAY